MGIRSLSSLLACLLSLPSLAEPKPWVDDPAAYLSRAGARRLVIGRSHGACLSPAEAETAALRDAAMQLAVDGAHRGDPPVLIDRTYASLASGRYVVDRSYAVAHKPYADVWSAAVLVDAPGNQLAAEAARWAAERRHARVRRAMGAGAAFAAVLAAYAVANAITKGYFRRRLRFAAVAGLACAATLAAAWAGA